MPYNPQPEPAIGTGSAAGVQTVHTLINGPAPGLSAVRYEITQTDGGPPALSHRLDSGGGTAGGTFPDTYIDIASDAGGTTSSFAPNNRRRSLRIVATYGDRWAPRDGGRVESGDVRFAITEGATFLVAVTFFEMMP